MRINLRFHLCFVLLFTLFFNLSPAQTFTGFTFGAPMPSFLGELAALDIIESSDSNYVLNLWNAELWKINPNGNAIWQYRADTSIFPVNGSAPNIASFSETHDGGFICAAHYLDTLFQAYFDQGMVIRLDANGNLLWYDQYAFSGPAHFQLNDIEATPDRGYVLVGTVFNFNGYQTQIIKYDAQRRIDWARNLPTSGNDRGYDVKVLRGGDLAFFSVSRHNTFADTAHVFLFSPQGVQRWSRSYINETRSSHPSIGSQLAPTQDGGLVVLTGLNGGNCGPTIRKLDSLGNQIWVKSYSVSCLDDWLAESIYQLHGGGYLVTGRQEFGTFPNYQDDAMLLRLDANGDSVWLQQFDYQGEHDNLLGAIPSTYDCRIVTVGAATNSTTGAVNAWMMRTPPQVFSDTAAFNTSATALQINFSDLSSNNGILNYSWDFGDGNHSTIQNPVHTYNQIGTYQVCLTITGDCGADTYCDSVFVNCPLPATRFGASSTFLTASFSDSSSGYGTQSWFWDFGDGDTSTVQHPSHQYAAPGTYLVCLTVTDLCGSATFCDSVLISCPVPVPGFQTSVSMDTAAFTDISTGTGISSWLWDFGDGNTSTLQNPVHVYAASGVYTVCLTTTNVCGSDSSCSVVNVSLVGVEDDLLMGFRLVPNPASGQVTLTSGQAASWPVALHLFAADGRLLVRDVLLDREEQYKLDVSEYPSGVYFLRLSDAAGRDKVLKLMVW